ncbi:MAG: tetratricopeptide repeat protein [Deltaproteobacteria bacterium]|nr:tetratricopeptide repeat protein [Deltaproteobacteria bacterium]
MLRTTVSILTLLLLVPVANADVVILRKGANKFQILGIKDKIGAVAINVQNVELFLDQSTGIIDREGYDGLDIRKNIKARTSKTYSWTQVARHFYSTEPDALLDGYDQRRLGNYAQANAAFREVLDDPGVREVFKPDAYFQMGFCYYSQGNVKAAIEHFSRWRWPNSRFTPEVKRFLAEIYTGRKQFITARDQYKKIAALPGIPPNWKYKAQLGNVKVDIAERKFAEAERTAKSIAAATNGKAELGDASVLAHVLQAEAILQAEEADRLPDAEALLLRAVNTPNVPDTTRAYLFTTLGDVQYKQGKLEDARFPYMRVVLMYPNEAGYVAHALLNAGQCFLDMSGRMDKTPEQATSDKYLINAMKLLAQCAGRYRGYDPARAAAKAYRAHKPRFDAIRAAEDKAGAGGSKGSKGKNPKSKAK